MDKREKMFEHIPNRRLYLIEIYRLEPLLHSKRKTNSGSIREVLMRVATANENLFFSKTKTTKTGQTAQKLRKVTVNI